MIDSSDHHPQPRPAARAIQKKKTRDLPNLSDCYGCNRRINATNPKDRLRILTSHWRIVLLCKRCYVLVESAKNCSYCLSDVSPAMAASESSCYQCRRCARQVHKECASRYSSVPPWSFLSAAEGNDFLVCVDCWIPKSLESGYRRSVIHRSKRKGKSIGESCSLGSSMVSDCIKEKRKLIDQGGEEGNCVLRKEVVMGDEDKEKAVGQGVVEKRVVELGGGAFRLVSQNKCSRAGDDDAQLAIQLHRAMNSSPRISRNLCSLNGSRGGVPRVMGCYGESLLGAVDVASDGLEMQGAVETSCSCESMNVGAEGNSMDLDLQSRGEQNGLCFVKGKQDCKVECGTAHIIDETENCDENKNRYLVRYSRRIFQDGRRNGVIDSCSKKYGRILSSLEHFRCNGEPDHILRTYSRRRSLLLQDEKFKVEPNNSLRTYSRRSLPLKDTKCNDELGHCLRTYSRRSLPLQEASCNGALPLSENT